MDLAGGNDAEEEYDEGGVDLVNSQHLRLGI